MVIDVGFWKNKRVFLTGHTGFKGAWLAMWLADMGAKVTGYSLPPPTSPSLFGLARVNDLVMHVEGDIRDEDALRRILKAAQPEVVFHMAAQPLVRLSYESPVETYATNVMGTVHLLDAVRQCASIQAVVCITSDKCYENKEWAWGYRETEPMGGFDPYSNSKACSELVISAYRQSFFHGRRGEKPATGVASARAGNVIGGGDWAKDRLIPDIMAAFMAGKKPKIRYPDAIRPWQHVLEPLRGYLMLAERLTEGVETYSEGWNFGPYETDTRPVSWIVDRLAILCGRGATWEVAEGKHPHEATYLKLDCSKARARLNWRPAWSLDEALKQIVFWYEALRNGVDMREVTLDQIRGYAALVAASGDQS